MIERYDCLHPNDGTCHVMPDRSPTGEYMKADDVIAQLNALSAAVLELNNLIDFGDFSAKWLHDKIEEMTGE